MSTIDITGRMTFPNSPNGSVTPVLIGTPALAATATSGLQVSYNEKAEFELTIAASAVRAVDFGSISSAKVVYIGTTQAITYTVNGGAEVFALAAGGFKLEVMSTVTALVLTAGAQEAGIYVLVLGD